MKTIISTAALASLLMIAPLSPGHAESSKHFISIGTGGLTGVYFPAGGAICWLVNRERDQHGFRCSADATAGSFYNVGSVREGNNELGIVQSDWHYHALAGTAKFKKNGAFEDMRSLFAMHPEPATLVVRADSEIHKVTDLKGKRFNVGKKGTGIRTAWAVMSRYFGLKDSDLKEAATLAPKEMEDALCNDRIDAFFIMVSHPSGLIRKTANTCKIRIVPIAGPEADKLVADFPFYRKATIPGGIYPGSPKAIPSYGVGATVISSANVSEDAIYAVVKSVFDNLRILNNLHPSFAFLNERDMLRRTLSAPFHAGALRYFRERGWIKPQETQESASNSPSTS